MDKKTFKLENSGMSHTLLIEITSCRKKQKLSTLCTAPV